MIDLARLPPELAAYTAAQWSDNKCLVFHGELSPFSNFHSTPFTMENQQFPTSEHYIQYNKAMFFDDTFTAIAIFNCMMPYEAKQLSHQINRSTEQIHMNGERMLIIYVTRECMRSSIRTQIY